MKRKGEVVDTFEIGSGLVVTLAASIDLPDVHQLSVVIRAPGVPAVRVRGYVPSVRRLSSEPPKYVSVQLPGVAKTQVPVGTILEIEGERPVGTPTTRFTCPCCGHRTLSDSPGSYEICAVCFWEDDGVQLLNPGFRGGANEGSLIECQDNYARFGASDARSIHSVRPPRDDEPLDPEWRRAEESDLQSAGAPRDLSTDGQSLETLSYWKRKAT
jgi:hypothetical protein